MPNSKKVFETLVSRTKTYIVIIFILLIIICILNVKLIIPSVIMFLLIIGYTYFANNKRKGEIFEHLQDLTITVDSTAKRTLINSPFPLVIMQTDGTIIWRSAKFISEFANIDINNYLNDLILDIKYEIKTKENKKNKSIIKTMKIDKKDYKIIGEYIKTKNKVYTVNLYFIDETENKKLQKEYTNSKSCVGIVVIDNYEEVMQRIENDEKPQLIAEIEKTIYEWANQTNGIIIKQDRDRYIYFFEKRYLENLKEEKFKILDEIKSINVYEKAPLTLSIAISSDGETDKDKYKSALDTLDVVLGRGGDQAAIKEKDRYSFYGGKLEEVEKRTKVKARIVAHALEELMQEASNIIIMGHSNPDIDSVGAGLGIYRFAKTLDKEAFIVNDSKGFALQNFIETLNKEGYSEVLIDKETAINITTQDSLLVIVDTHKVDYVQVPELLEQTNKIVIIDHHRRSTQFIEKSLLTFQEVYASSACELVTELLQYEQETPKLTTIESEGLYAGIMMDTKNFTFKTGVRTFEAAAYLRRCGVDIIKVKKWFQSDLESYNKIADIVKNAEIIYNSIGIAIYDLEDAEAGLMCAKAADELLTISNVLASFVIGSDGERVLISGRSMGDINVQIILEKLGGGGHIALAGAQIEGMTKDEVKLQLISKIDEYFEEIAN